MPTVPSNLEGALLATAFVFAVFTVDLGTLALCFLPAVEADAVRGGAPRGAAGSALDAKSAGRRRSDVERPSQHRIRQIASQAAPKHAHQT